MRNTYRIDDIIPTETALDVTKLDDALKELKEGKDITERCQVTTANGQPFLTYGTECAVLLALNKRRYIQATLREDLMTDIDAAVCDSIQKENFRCGVLCIRDLIKNVPDRVKYWILEY